MTTSEFIIGHSADDAAERKAELRKIAWAVLAALFLHVVIGYFLATFSGLFFSSATPIEDEDKPVELTMINLPPQPTPQPKTQPVLETQHPQQSLEPPQDADFQASANSVAASERPPIGRDPLPSQTGTVRPDTVALETRDYSPELKGAAQQSESPAETAQPEQLSTPKPDSNAEQFAMLFSTPRPVAPPHTSPEPKQTFQDFKQKTRITGSISNRGPSSVKAVGTTLGRYEKIWTQEISSRWNAFLETRGESADVGTVKLRWVIDRSGRIKDIRVLGNTSNETFLNICLQAVIDAKLPPIPEDLVKTLPEEGLVVDEMTFNLIPNQGVTRTPD